MKTKENRNPKKTARIAGFLYVLMIPLGLFGIMYVPTFLIVEGDTITTTVINDKQTDKTPYYN